MGISAQLYPFNSNLYVIFAEQFQIRVSVWNKLEGDISDWTVKENNGPKVEVRELDADDDRLQKAVRACSERVRKVLGKPRDVPMPGVRVEYTRTSGCPPPQPDAAQSDDRLLPQGNGCVRLANQYPPTANGGSARPGRHRWPIGK